MLNLLLKKGNLTGSELLKLAKAMNLKISIYQYDSMPKHLKQGNYIILLGQGHGHWVSLVVYKNTAAYYDSFAIPPPNEIIKAVGRRILFFNKIEEQRLNMNHCGQLCLRFIYRLNNEKPL